MTMIHDAAGVTLIHGDILDPATTAGIPDGSVRAIVTSPPYYGLRDYGEDAQLGAERSVGEYVANMVAVFANLRRALADDGTLWLNLGDSYQANMTGTGGYSSKSTLAGYTSENTKHRQANTQKDARVSRRFDGVAPKNLLGIPWRVAFALQDDGWILRSDIIWAKPNPMPESVTDRPTKAHEYLFLFAKNPRYYYDADAIKEAAITGFNGSEFHTGKTGEHQLGRASTQPRFGGNKQNGGRTYTGNEYEPNGLANKRTVWTVPTVPFPGSHFAVYPPELIRPCIRAGSAIGDTILDPFSGSGTTGMVARQEGRNYIGIDLNRDYLDLSLRTRFAQPVLDMWGEAAS